MPSNSPILQYGTIHIIGIGGIGMSGIAEILHALGAAVQGSDMAENANVERLRAKGIKVFIGQSAENIAKVSLVVKSTAIKETNPELAAAREAGVKVIHRAEMLAEIMKLKRCVSIAGTHGKTTTTTMMAALFDAAQANASVLNGGVINAYGSNARWGDSDWLIVEADESDGTFIRVPSSIGVITNIDPEHLEHYGSFEALKDAFRTFIENLPSDGFAVLCADHTETAALATQGLNRDVFTYGVNDVKADVVAYNLDVQADGTEFDVTFSEQVAGSKLLLQKVKVAMPGHHNVLNALAVLTVGAKLGFDAKILQTALASFQGVQRRFTKVGEVDGVTIIDDYAHHPVEIAATLSAARGVADSVGGRVIAVMQPHRYSRLEALFHEFSSCFESADKVLVSDVFAAGEVPIDGVDAEHLIAAIEEKGQCEAVKLESQEVLAPMIADIVKPNDIVICLGAGNITYWARSLASELESLKQQVVSS